MDAETVIKESGKALLGHIRELTGTEAREIQDLVGQIEVAFEMAVLSGSATAMEDLTARTKALIELSRLTAIRIKEEAILQSVLTGAKIVKSLLFAL